MSVHGQMTLLQKQEIKQTIILEFAGDRQNLPQLTEGQVVLLVCL